MSDTTTEFICRACKGEGGFVRAVCGHSGACPCDGVDVDCDACGGTGVEPCHGCRERPAVWIDPVLGPQCAECMEPEEVTHA